MSDTKLVTCGEHGETPATFACCHLTLGVACGYHASADALDDPWPNAWCDLCEEAFQAQGGEWNDVSEKVADIKLMCTDCYDAARDRNAEPPRLARGARARLSATEAKALVHHATHEMQTIQAASQKRWGWNTMASWDFDDEASTLTFSDPARPSTIADVRLVGSYSTKTNTFQWAWHTFDDCAPEAHDIARLRIFGEVRGLSKLTTANWKCDEAAGWEMASIAGYVLGTEAVYRAPFDHQRWFMLLSNLRHTN
ncbi:MAG TPA: hypothetical protein VK427_08945 [Kofleriaceae bacterium]|nr:hypothetical protein [Kofleriaceae bacterium]